MGGVDDPENRGRPLVTHLLGRPNTRTTGRLGSSAGQRGALRRPARLRSRDAETTPAGFDDEGVYHALAITGPPESDSPDAPGVRDALVYLDDDADEEGPL